MYVCVWIRACVWLVCVCGVSGNVCVCVCGVCDLRCFWMWGCVRGGVLCSMEMRRPNVFTQVSQHPVHLLSHRGRCLAKQTSACTVMRRCVIESCTYNKSAGCIHSGCKTGRGVRAEKEREREKKRQKERERGERETKRKRGRDRWRAKERERERKKEQKKQNRATARGTITVAPYGECSMGNMGREFAHQKHTNDSLSNYTTPEERRLFPSGELCMEGLPQ